jgi:hypothetical protein
MRHNVLVTPGKPLVRRSSTSGTKKYVGVVKINCAITVISTGGRYKGKDNSMPCTKNPSLYFSFSLFAPFLYP